MSSAKGFVIRAGCHRRVRATAFHPNSLFNTALNTLRGSQCDRGEPLPTSIPFSDITFRIAVRASVVG